MRSALALAATAAAAVAALFASPASAIDIRIGDGSVSSLDTPINEVPAQADGTPYPGTALYTNAVTYCAEAKAVLIDSFDIAYWGHNNSVTFSFSFASVEPDLNVSASLYLNAYGIELFDRNISLCDLVSGILCPLPQVNFTGYGTYPLNAVDVLDKIPNIAWTVPNIEAYARIELLRVDNGEIAACLQATLANGWTTQRSAVKYASGFFTLGAAVIGLIHSVFLRSASPAIYRWFDILYLYQTAAAGGMMHLNYPLAFSNFAQNFGWAMGLFYSAPMQHSITKMRNKTGGKMPGDAFSEVQYINRKLSPYNEFISTGAFSNMFMSRGVDLTSAVATPANFTSYMARLPRLDESELSTHLARRGQIPTLHQQTGANELTTGLPVYTNSRGIAVANAFDTVFFVFLAFLGIMVAFHVILGALVWVLSRGHKGGRVWRWASRMRNVWWDFCSANGLRTCIIFFTPLFILGFYQWTIGTGDSGLSLFFSIFAMLLVFAPLVTVFVISLLVARRARATQDVSPLYTNHHFYRAVGDALYRQYRQRYHFFWFAPVLLAMIARSGFIAFGHRNDWAQVIGSLVVEFIVLCCQIVLHPYKLAPHTGRENCCVSFWRFFRVRLRLPVWLTLFRMIYFGLCVAFIESVGVKPIPRTVIGIVQIAVIGIPTVLLLIATIYNAGYGLLWRRHATTVEDGSELEQPDNLLTATSSHSSGPKSRVSRVVSHADEYASASFPKDSEPSSRPASIQNSNLGPAHAQDYANPGATAATGGPTASAPPPSNLYPILSSNEPANDFSRPSIDIDNDFSRPSMDETQAGYAKDHYSGNGLGQALDHPGRAV